MECFTNLFVFSAANLRTVTDLRRTISQVRTNCNEPKVLLIEYLALPDDEAGIWHKCIPKLFPNQTVLCDLDARLAVAYSGGAPRMTIVLMATEGMSPADGVDMGEYAVSVSYTHLTLPTIYSV